MEIGPREGVLLGANLGRAIVTNGDFTAYVCDSAATRPSSQITLGKVVYLLISNKGPYGPLQVAYSHIERYTYNTVIDKEAYSVSNSLTVCVLDLRS